MAPAAFAAAHIDAIVERIHGGAGRAQARRPRQRRHIKVKKQISIIAAASSLALTLGGAGCGVDQNVYNAAVKDRDEKTAALTQTKADLDKEKLAHKKDADRAAAMSKKLEALGQDVSRLEVERTGLGGELDEAKKRMEELRKAQAQAEARAAQFRNLVTQFKTLTDAGKLKVEIRENRMIIALGDKILFDPGKTDLKPEGKDALTQVTVVLKDVQNRNFQVAGHTDNIPIKSAKFRSNWDLSTARAVEVVNFMIGAGMEPKRLSAAGYADTSPVAPNDTPENKAKNRRIEITLVPNLDDLPPIDEALKDPTAPAAATPPPIPTPNKS
jgi:chemotaxis protein MotB